MSEEKYNTAALDLPDWGERNAELEAALGVYRISYSSSLHNYSHSSVNIKGYSNADAVQKFRVIYGDFTKFVITDVVEVKNDQGETDD